MSSCSLGHLKPRERRPGCIVHERNVLRKFRCLSARVLESRPTHGIMGVVRQKVVDLRSLQAVRFAGSVLPKALFEWFYDHALPQSVYLCNVSGGTTRLEHWSRAIHSPCVCWWVSREINWCLAVGNFDQAPLGGKKVVGRPMVRLVSWS